MDRANILSLNTSSSKFSNRGGAVRISLRCFAAAVWIVLANASHAAAGRIISAQSDFPERAIENEGSCPIMPSPKAVWLKIGHVHEVVVSEAGPSLKWEVLNRRIATAQVVDPSGRRAKISGHGLGETQLIILTASGQEVARLTIHGISRRYTVVSWIDGSRINPEKMAANEALKKVLKYGCVAETFLWWIGVQGLVDSPDDVAYAKAFLIHATSNKTPPQRLTESFFQDITAYKLWNDFQVNVRSTVVVRSRVGHTPFPCAPQLRVGWEGDPHSENGTAKWNASGTMFSLINEARIGKEAQDVERAIDPTGPGTPWIWSVLGFDKSGAPSLDVQLFPTYWVYEDGVFCGSRKQHEFAQFVSGTTSGELKRSDLDRYERGDWSEPCTEK